MGKFVPEILIEEKDELPKYYAQSDIHTGVFGSVEVCTTGFQGGDAGHGGEARVRIHIDEGFDHYKDDTGCLVLRAQGDFEMENLLKSLEFAAESLKKLLGKSKYEQLSLIHI